MLRFNYIVNVGLVGALVLPPILLRGPQELDQALADTVAALDGLVAIEADVKSGEDAALGRIRTLTEEPYADERERDDLLVRLREDVNRLLMLLDAAETGADTLAPTRAPGAAAPEVVGAATVGLSDAQRAALSTINPPVTGPSTPPGAAGATRTEAPVSFEPEGFSADPVRHGRAYYRAGRYVEGLKMLRLREGEPEADYWSGRCLERLGRDEEAIAAYTRVIDQPAGGGLAARARNDREFIQWKLEFGRREARRATGAATGTGGGAGATTTATSGAPKR